MYMSMCSSIYSTISDYTIIYDRVNKITVDTVSIENSYRFNHVKTLELKCSLSLGNLASIINLNQIKHLSITSLDKLLEPNLVKYQVPQLDELTITECITLNTINQIRGCRYDQIRKLEISEIGEHWDDIINELFCLFPRVEHFIYMKPNKTKAIIVRLIDGFQYLSLATFYGDSSFSRNELKFCRNPNSIIHHAKTLTKGSFTCQVYHSSCNKLPFCIVWRKEELVSV